jgi:methylaspartate mutase epsilon subunit
VRAQAAASRPRGRDSLLRSSRDHAAIRDREPGQRVGPEATDDGFDPFGSPTPLRRPAVVATIDLTDPSEHARDLVALWRNGAELHASSAPASGVEQFGVRGLEQIADQTPVTNQLRLTGADPRLAAEIALASGFRSLHGPGVAGAVALQRRSGSGAAVHSWHYVDQLMGWYEGSGIALQRSYAAPLQGMICPPAVMCASLVLDALVGAEAGVRHLVLEAHENVQLQQDVATLRLLPRLARTYLRRLGHENVSVAAALKIWSGDWPELEPDAFGLLGFAVLTASLGGATAVVIHPGTPPDIGDLAKRARFARAALVVTGSQRYPDSASIAALEASIEREAQEMIDATLAIETGDVHAAVALAFERGIVEVPLSAPSLLPLRVRQAFDAEWAKTG